MALVVEDGTGLTTANSYATVAEADSYLETNSHVFTTWDALDDTAKGNALQQATLYLDRYVDWFGTKVYQDGALRWPRSGVKDRDGFYYAINEIPVPLKQATAELAYELSQEDLDASSSSKGLTEVTIDVIRVKFDKTDRKTAVPSSVRSILRGLGYMNIGSGFKKVVRS